MGFLVFLIILVVIIISFLNNIPQGKQFLRDAFSKKKMTGVLIIIAVFLILAIISQGIVIVHPGEMVIKFNRLSAKGNLSTLSQGFHIIFPFIYKLDKYDIRIQEYTMSISSKEGQKYGDDAVWSPTKEGLQVGVDVTTWYRINPDDLVNLHKDIGKNYEIKIIRPSIRSTIRNTVSQYGVMELYSLKRNEVQQDLFNRLKEDLVSYGFIIDNLLLREIAFPKEFERAIEEKQIAEQQSQKMEYILDREAKEAERKKIEAQGEANKINIINEALRRSPNYVNYLYVDKLSDKIKVIVSDQATIMNLEKLIDDDKKVK